MSLALTIKQVANIKAEGPIKIDSKMTLIAQNNKGGALLLSKIKFNRLEWEEPFKFFTNIDQNVEFLLINGDEKAAQLKENILGKGTLYTKKFLKMFQQKIQELKKQNQPFQYQITLFKQTKNDEIVTGIIKLDIEYDCNNNFEGKVVSNVNLDLRGEVHTNPKFVKFYLGKSSKINLFSLFDGKVSDQKFRFIESIYKDLE